MTVFEGDSMMVFEGDSVMGTAALSGSLTGVAGTFCIVCRWRLRCDSCAAADFLTEGFLVLFAGSVGVIFTATASVSIPGGSSPAVVHFLPPRPRAIATMCPSSLAQGH